MPKSALLASCVLLLGCGALTGCGALLAEGTATGAGIAGAGISGSVTHNAALATGIGLGVQAVADTGLQYAERRIHSAEQDTIATAAAPLNEGDLGAWSVSHTVPIEPDEHGSVMVSRVFGSDAFRCKEIVFSVDTPADKDKPAGSEFYVAAVCRDGNAWKWASAEPAVARWGALQ